MSPIDELYAILPWWAGWGQLFVWPPLLYILTWIVASIGAAFALRPLRKVEADAWVERARVAHTARRVSLVTAIYAPGVAIFLAVSFASVISLVPMWLTIVLAAVVSILALVNVAVRTERRLQNKPCSLRQLWQTTVIYTFVLRSGFLPIFLIAMALMPRQFNAVAAAVAAGAVLVLLALSCGGSIHVLRLLGYVKPASSRSFDITAQAADRIGRTPRKIYEFESQTVNAFAHALQGWIGFTRGILDEFSDEELVAIAAHELEHLAMPRRVMMIRLVIFYVWFLPLLFFKPVVASYGLEGVCWFGAGFLLLTVAVGKLQWRLMTREEQRADESGARHEVDEGSYARALEKIYRLNLVPVTWKSPHGHAPLYDRMIAAGVEPNYPRPRPPSRIRILVGVLLQLVVYLVLLTGIAFVSRSADRVLNDYPVGRLAWLAFVGGREHDVEQLGDLRWDAGRTDEAIIFYRAAAVMDDESAWYSLALANALSGTGRCAEAAAALDEAERRAARYDRWSKIDEWIKRSREGVSRCGDEAQDNDSPVPLK